MIPGSFAIIGGGSGKTANFVASRSSENNGLTTYTFADVPLGYYDPTRIIVLSVHWYRYDTSASITSATVGGSSTTSRASTSRLVYGGSGSYVYCDLRTAAPTGATGNISLSFNRGLNYGCVIGVWALYNVGSATPVATNVANTSGLFTLSAQPNDLVVAAATSVYYGTNTTWTNATENFDVINTSLMLSSGAQREALVAGDPAISFTMNSDSTPVGVAGIWR